jgi:chromosome segregation ATPase
MNGAQDMDVMKETAVELRTQAEDNKRTMVQLNASVAENRKDILNLEVRTNVIQDDLEALRTKISEVNELRQLVKVCPLPSASFPHTPPGSERTDR